MEDPAISLDRRTVLESGLSALVLSGLAPAALRAQRITFDRDPFTLGVASGYPEPGAVVLWTRLAPEPLAPGGGMPAAVVEVDWEVAEDERFSRIVRSGKTHAEPDWAHSVHIEAAGLEPGRTYFYRFASGGAQSPVGRTATAPEFNADPSHLRVGLACCQHYESGYYAAYRAMAEDDLDLIVHVGDYIYETRGVQPVSGRTPVRAHDFPEAFTLDDYRQRYALYKLDEDLKLAHAACPWLVTWDDHEVANDYADWRSADNDVAELFLARRAAAYQAYYEHMPLPRRLLPFGAHQRLHTRRRFGQLLDVVLLDGRQYRSDQACGSRLASPCAELYDDERTMLGRAQEDWLDGVLPNTRGRWNLFAQQTVFAHMDQAAGPGIGYWADGWSGYPAARERMIGQLETYGTKNPVILSGDVHGFLVNDIHRNPGDLDSPVAATEIVTTSISSNGPPQTAFDTWKEENANVRFARSDRRGYTRLTIEPAMLRADLMAVDDPGRADSPVRTLESFEIESGRAGVAR